MFPSLIIDGLCSGKKCNPVSYDTYMCNGKAFETDFQKKVHTLYSAGSGKSRGAHGNDGEGEGQGEGLDPFIPNKEIESALAHQQYVETRLEERFGAADTSLRRSMSFAESTLSGTMPGSMSGAMPGSPIRHTQDQSHISDNHSIASNNSSHYSMFSAITAITGHTNKYGMPKVNPNSNPTTNTQRRKLKRRSDRQRLSSTVEDRYALEEPSMEESNDWDYTMDVQMVDSTTTPKRNNTSSLKSVLHLKMNARMSDFYREEFLLSFPQFPVPKEMDMHKAVFQSNFNWKKPVSRARNRRSLDYMPGLVQSASSMSSSSEQSSVKLPTSFGAPLLMAVDGSNFLGITVAGCLGLVDSRSSMTTCRDPNKKYIVIGDHHRSEKPMLVCCLKSSKGKPDVRILSTQPRMEGQEPITLSSDELGITEDSYTLYSWAELRTENEFPDENAKYSLHMSDGTKNKFHEEPTYTALHESAGATDLTVFRRKVEKPTSIIKKGKVQETKSELLHCARICVRTDSDMCNQETSYMISVVKDTGFTNIIAMVAIIDELIEFAMRKKCAMQAWKFASMNK